MEKQTSYCAELDLYSDPDCSDPDCMIKRTDVKGLMIGTEYIGHSVIRGRVVPITKFGYYQKAARLKKEPKQRDMKTVWDKSWYVEPIDAQKKTAWTTSAEFVGEQEPSGG